jgi:hypothetical protein
VQPRPCSRRGSSVVAFVVAGELPTRGVIGTAIAVSLYWLVAVVLLGAHFHL